MKELRFYGKEIGELNENERQLLHIDNMLLLSFRLRENNNTINIGGIELGSHKSIKTLSRDRYLTSLKLMGMEEDTPSTREVMEMLEDTRYSFQMFIRDYMKLGNVVSQFIDERMVSKDKNEFNRICLN